MNFITTIDAGIKWHISRRRVEILCMLGRIQGAVKIANVWLIPQSAEKPADQRLGTRNGDTVETAKRF
jgi:hypothetical protein